MKTNKLALTYITCKNTAEAKKIVNHLLSKKLIACANLFPITSIYNWKGKQVNIKEIVLLGKTTADKYKSIQEEVKKIHSYEVPCILLLDAKSNESYFSWVKSEIQ